MKKRLKFFVTIGVTVFVLISIFIYTFIQPKDVINTLVTDADRFEIAIDRITLWEVHKGKPPNQIFTATKGEPLYEKSRKTLQQWRVKRQWFQNDIPIQHHYKMALIDEERPETTTILWISKDGLLSAYDKNYTLIHGSINHLLTER